MHIFANCSSVKYHLLTKCTSVGDTCTYRTGVPLQMQILLELWAGRPSSLRVFRWSNLSLFRALPSSPVL